MLDTCWIYHVSLLNHTHYTQLYDPIPRSSMLIRTNPPPLDALNYRECMILYRRDFSAAKNPAPEVSSLSLGLLHWLRRYEISALRTSHSSSCVSDVWLLWRTLSKKCFMLGIRQVTKIELSLIEVFCGIQIQYVSHRPSFYSDVQVNFQKLII